MTIKSRMLRRLSVLITVLAFLFLKALTRLPVVWVRALWFAAHSKWQAEVSYDC